MRSVIRSALDIGTNAVKYVVVEVGDEGLETLLQSERIARLGEGSLESGELQPVAVQRTLAAIEEMLAEGELFQPLTTDAIGTQALRRAKN
ncbi:Ppx/GppA family phosphatase, partial [bacterium]|nr:Ppx/GppA family phosphatase [bacterium]